MCTVVHENSHRLFASAPFWTIRSMLKGLLLLLVVVVLPLLLLAFRPYLNTYERYLLNLVNLGHNSSIIVVLDHAFDHLERTSAAMQKFVKKKNLWLSAVVYNLYPGYKVFPIIAAISWLYWSVLCYNLCSTRRPFFFCNIQSWAFPLTL